MTHAANQLRRITSLVQAGCPPQEAIRLEHYWQSAELNGWDTIPERIADTIRSYTEAAGGTK